MYQVLIEISSYRQLSRVSPQFVTNLQREIGAVFADRGASCAFNDGEHLLYEFRALRPGDAGIVADAGWSVIAILRDVAGDLNGFAVLIDHRPVREDALRAMRNVMRSVTADQELLLTPTAANLLSEFFETAMVGGLLRVVRPVEQTNSRLGSLREFCRRSEELARVSATWTDFADETLLLYRGDAAMGVRQMADHLAHELAGGSDRQPLLHLPVAANAEWPFAPIGLLLSDAVVDMVDAYLSPVERAEVADRRAITAFLRWADTGDQVFPDAIETDIAILLRTVLTGFGRRQQSMGAIGVLLIDDVSAVAMDVLDQVFTALDDLRGDYQFAVVAGCRSLRVPDVVTRRRPLIIDAAPVGSDEIRDLIIDFSKTGGVGRLDPFECERVSRGRVEALFNVFALAEKRMQVPTAEAIEDLQTAVLGILPAPVLEYWYVLLRCKGAFSFMAIVDFVTKIGFERVRIPEMTVELVRRGFVHDQFPTVPLADTTLAFTRAQLGEQAGVLDRALSAAIIEHWQHGLVAYRADVTMVLRGLGPQVEHCRYFRRFVFWLFAVGWIVELQAILYDSTHLLPVNEEQPDNQAANVAAIAGFRLRLALVRDMADRAQTIAQTLVESAASPRNGWHFLDRARLQHIVVDDRSAMELAKKSIIAFQDADDALGLAEANQLFAAAQLLNKNFNMAREYSTIARAAADAAAHPAGVVYAELIESVTLFVQGAFSKSTDLLPQIVRQSRILGLRNFECVGLLMEIRTMFELGRYQDCETQARSAQKLATATDNPAAAAVFEAWAWRAVAYANAFLRESGAAVHQRGADAALETAMQTAIENAVTALAALAERCDRTASVQNQLFWCEALWMAGRIDDALEVAERLVENNTSPAAIRQVRRQVLGMVDWVDGFAGLEDRQWSQAECGMSQADRLATGFAAYLRGSVATNQSGCVDVLKDLVRGAHFVAGDPFNRYYCYWYTTVLPEQRTQAFDDRVTVLGRAVKYVQERSSRIDIPTDRHAFMWDNYWNHRLMTAAKRHNLV